MDRQPMMILVMGVAGAGKTTVGGALAARLGWRFVDADDDHPPSNVAKMRAGIPLDEGDRAPWLAAVRARVRAQLERGENVVLACSALRRSYRAFLAEVPARVAVVHLSARADLVAERMEAREGHFMPAALLPSQYDALESADDALVVDASAPPETIVDAILSGLHLQPD